jgi:hypothetical protein
MPDIFKAKIAQQLNKGMGKLLFPITLTRKDVSLRPDNLTDGVSSVETTYSGRGFMVDYRASQIDGTLVQVMDRQVIILGGSLSVVPQSGDLVVSEGKQYTIIHVNRDPAGATYTCQVR